jgi:hypothetical protein
MNEWNNSGEGPSGGVSPAELEAVRTLTQRFDIEASSFTGTEGRGVG